MSSEVNLFIYQASSLQRGNTTPAQNTALRRVIADAKELGSVTAIMQRVLEKIQKEERAVTSLKAQAYAPQTVTLPKHLSALPEDFQKEIRKLIGSGAIKLEELTPEIVDDAIKQVASLTGNNKWFYGSGLSPAISRLAAAHYPYIGIPSLQLSPTPEDVKAVVLKCTGEPIWKKLKGFTSLVTLGGNHWGLVYIDRERKTVEYFDSLSNWGDYSKYEKNLNELCAELSKIDGGTYRYVRQIRAAVQTDGYQCGAWAYLFLKERLERPDRNFESLTKSDVETAREEIRLSHFAFRIKEQIYLSKIADREKMREFITKMRTEYYYDHIAWIHTIGANSAPTPFSFKK